MIQPVNRYLYVENNTKESIEEESGILLPDDFKPKEERYTSVIVRAWASDVRFTDYLVEGATLIVDRTMLEEISLNDKTITVIQDNYVIAITDN
jgi:co-chaperonin GroES (HSP10)